MTKKTLEKQLSDNDTLESLLASLAQAMQAKKQNDATIAHIRESLAERIEEMQQAKAMLDGVMASETAESAIMPPTLLRTAVRRLPSFLWQWVIPAVVMFTILWIVMWALQNITKEENAHWQIPSLIETAHAFSGAGCTLFDRIQERRVNRAEALPKDPIAELPEIVNDSDYVIDFSEESPEVFEETKEPSVEEVPTFFNRRHVRRPFLQRSTGQIILRNLFKSLCKT